MNKNKSSLNLLKTFFVISRIFPTSYAVRMAEKQFTTHFPSERRGVEQNLLKNAERFYISQKDGTKIAAYQWGKKNDPIVLFVHGWTATGTCFIKFIKPLLENGYQVIAYDSIAHGDTQGATSASVTQWADALVSVNKEIGKVHCMIGHSLGAGAIVIASSSLKLEMSRVVLISPVTNIIRVTEKFAKTLLISENILKQMHRYAWKKYQESAVKYGNDWQDIFKSNINVPTLIIHDLDDLEIDIKETRKLAKRIPQAKLLETQKLGHRRILLNPRIIRKIISFVEE